MKKTLVITALLAVGSLSAYSQGTIQWNDNKSDFKIHIYSPQLVDGSVEQTGNGPTDKAVGTTVYTGQLLGGSTTQGGTYNYSDGADYTVQLQAAAGENMAVTSLAPVTQYTSTIYYTTVAGAGLFTTTSPSPDPGIPGVTLGNDSATLAIACWYNDGGTITSLSAAQTAGVPWGESLAANFTTLGNLGSPASTAPDLAGLQSFSLVVSTPEPSTIALGVIGASAFLFRRRK